MYLVCKKISINFNFKIKYFIFQQNDLYRILTILITLKKNQLAKQAKHELYIRRQSDIYWTTFSLKWWDIIAKYCKDVIHIDRADKTAIPAIQRITTLKYKMPFKRLIFKFHLKHNISYVIVKKARNATFSLFNHFIRIREFTKMSSFNLLFLVHNNIYVKIESLFFVFDISSFILKFI